MHSTLVRLVLHIFSIGVVGACAGEAPLDSDVVDAPGLDDNFARAAATYEVPVDLLKAIAYVETGWNMVEGAVEHEGRMPGAGLFALCGENLEQGAAAAGIDPELARDDVDANIGAAAARIATLARSTGVAGDELDAWRPVITAYARTGHAESDTSYSDDVMTVLARGATSIAEDGSVIASIAPHLEITAPERGTPRASTDFPGAVLRSSPNFNSRGGLPVSLVVIHTCEGNYAGCWGWLRNPAAGASAHYVVKEDGSEITQLVHETNRAWHVAANYSCARAGGAQCNRNGVSTNSFAVGIEHAGFASQASFQDGMIEASARLTCDITKSHNIPRDRNHIVSHGQLQPWDRTDPGPNWPWSQYIDRVRAICGDGGGGGGGASPIVIDSNNANNNAAVARLEVTGTWTASNTTPGYYGTGYWYAKTEPVSAPVTFWFYLPAAATRTIDAWWTSGTDRSSAAPFIGFNAAGAEVGRRAVDQRTSGSQWVTLGTWSFSAGWNKVVLSRWTNDAALVIADAIRVR